MIYLFKIWFRYFFSRKQHYVLFLLQNNNELRSTGGFITHVFELSIGRFRIGGRFLNVNMDIVHYDDVVPPDAMKRLLKVSRVQFRDANFDPDFENASKELIKIYGLSFPNKFVSQVWAINFSLLENVLDVIGGVKVGKQIFNKDNLFFNLSSDVSDVDFHDVQVLKERKGLVKVIFYKIIFKSLLLFWKWGRLYRLFRRSILNKNIQIFMSDLNEQKGLIKKKLYLPFNMDKGGAFFSVVDNNYLGIKSNRYIRRIVYVDVVFDIDDDGVFFADVKIKVEMSHFGVRNYPLSGLYQSNISFYLPFDAENVLFQGDRMDDLKVIDNKFKVVDFDNLLNVGKFRVWTLSYRLYSSLFSSGKFRFQFVKQSGVLNESLFVSVRFPQYFFVKCYDGKCMENVALLNYFDVKKDVNFELEFKKNFIGPRVFLHEIIGHNLIEIRFNCSVVFDESKGDLISIIDKETGEKLQVDFFEFKEDRRRLLIHTVGMKNEVERFYLVRLFGLVDDVGVGMHVDGRKCTVVYRPSLFK